MAENDRDLFPNMPDLPLDMPDEVIEQHLSQFSAENEQLVSELREQHSLTRARQARALARGWERIQQAQQPPGVPFTAKNRQETLSPARDEIKRKLYMREIPPGTKRPVRLKRIVNILVAAVLLAVVAGSLVLVYSHVSPQTGVGSGGSPVAATPTQASSTPTQASPTPTQAGVTPQPTSAVPTVAGTQTITNCRQSLNWPYGQSTYWANYRYHQLTGYWVCWTGNADQWVESARQAGWHVSTSPHVPSIVILMPYVQGASAYGHPAVVESLVNSQTVHASNMNWAANGGGVGKVSYANFTTGPGVYFIWR